LIYVARFDFTDVSSEGVISVLQPETGEVDHEIIIPGCSEITGLVFLKSQPEALYATETSTNSLLKILIGN